MGLEKYSTHIEKNSEQDCISKEVIENIILNYPEDILDLLANYKKFGILYHGTSADILSREVLPPNATQIISEKGRNKNLNQVFFTKEPRSAEIYAKRAANSYGGTPRVLKVLPAEQIIY